MKYSIGSIHFKTKTEIIDHCRMIRDSTPSNQTVAGEHLPFLFDLFKYHDEWAKKSSGGLAGISTATTPHGTRCFILVFQIGRGGMSSTLNYELSLR